MQNNKKEYTQKRSRERDQVLKDGKMELQTQWNFQVIERFVSSCLTVSQLCTNEI